MADAVTKAPDKRGEVRRKKTLGGGVEEGRGAKGTGTGKEHGQDEEVHLERPSRLGKSGSWGGAESRGGRKRGARGIGIEGEVEKGGADRH